MWMVEPRGFAMESDPPCGERERERESRIIPAKAFGANQLICLFLNSTLNWI